jgi:hypothetical protein
MKLLFRSCLAILFLVSGCASAKTKICPMHVEFTKPMKINFTENEQMLLCGDPTKDSWKVIPPAQVEFTLRNYLKQRAYYTPTFHYQDDTLSVDPGPLKLVTSLTFEGAPKDFDQIKLRDIVG